MSQVPAFVSLVNSVKEKIETTHQQGVIRQRVVDHLAEEENKRRTELLIKALEHRKAADKELQKIKPDNIIFDAEGKEISNGFTKAGLENLKKAKEKLARVDKAIAAAIENANYNDLDKLGKAPESEEKTN